MYTIGTNNDNGKRIYPTWDNTDPTSTVFSIGPTGQTNESGIDYVAYCWSEIPGYSKFGEYEGSNGPLTIETGFTPRWILFKSHNTSGQEWVIKDNVMQPDNLYADRTNVFDSNRTVTFNATGFTISDSQGPMNWPGRSYIYAAFGDDFDPLQLTPLSISRYCRSRPRNGGEFAANYAKMSTIDKGSGATISKGGLTVSHPGSATWNNGGIRGTIGVSSGQWYWEVTKASDTPFSMYGVATSLADFSESYSTPTHTWTYISNGGNKLGDGVGGAGASYGISYDAGDVIGVALDMDAGTLTFYKNGVSQGVAFSSLAGKTVFPWIHLYSNQDLANLNFGGRPFEYAAPAGHKCLTQQSIDASLVPLSDTAFDTVLYTGMVELRRLTLWILPQTWYGLRTGLRRQPRTV